MELRELGNTGVKVPEVGLGTWNYKTGPEPIRKAVELGSFLIDTAEMYGTEEAVGEAIKPIRDQVFLASKVSGNHLRYDMVLEAAEGSLRRMGVDYMDLYQIHWPSHTVAIKDTMRAMETLVDRGLVKYIGVSNFNVQEMRDAMAAMSNYPIVANQVKYSLQVRHIERGLIPFCEENKVTVIGYSPLAVGALAPKSGDGSGPGFKALQQVAQKHGKTVAQTAMAWCLRHPSMIVIPKSQNLGRIEENCGAAGWQLDTDDLQALDKAFPA
ncbi:MAG: aldo/keto reductase [Chloroflexi bacterium]|nr:aldo/keto reductase [Chloroflexota bacterium]